jgi:transcriptional regulator with XRE-family HTH domain
MSALSEIGLADSWGMNQREFGQRVYRLRMARKWTQEVCADRATISVRTLKMIEAYRIQPTIDTVQKLVVAFRCSWEDLLGAPSCPLSIFKAPRSKNAQA